MSKEENSDGAPQEGAGGGESSRKETDIYENRRTKKIIRLVTVMAYMFSVSFVAIVLSAYYLFLWEPPNPRLIRRPVQLFSEPEVQYLQGDKMTVQDDPNNPAQHFNATNVLFLDRIVDIEKPVNNYDHVKEHRERSNESLFLLPNSLIESWKNGINNANSFVQDSSRENGTSNFFNYTSFEKEKTLNLTRKLNGRGTKDTSKITNRMFGNNGTFQILESSTIFGNETNNDHFTNTRNYSESPQDIFPLNHNFTKVTSRKENKNNVLSSFKAETETFNKKGAKIKTPQYPEMHLSNGRFINTTMTIMTINDKKNFDIRNSREDRAYNINDIKQTINLNKQTTLHSSRNLELENRLEYSEQSNKLPGKLANIALKFKARSRMQLPRKMSAQNVMASISRTLGNREHKPAGNEIRFAGDERKDKLYEPKHKQKLVRVLTVVAYVIFVSMAAILLSLYYTFLWDPKDVPTKTNTKSECDTQTEKMTTKLTTMTSERSMSEIITTPRQKDLLTILTEIAESSTASSLTILEDLQTSPSTETKEISTKTHSNIN